MDQIFFYALAISVVYFIFKFLEMKFVQDDDKKPLKNVIHETIAVFMCSLVGIYIYSQFDIDQITTNNAPTAFIDSPQF